METTFMTIHSKLLLIVKSYSWVILWFMILLPEANIMFASESISDILGYEPEDVVGKPWFDYFDKNNDDTPMARQVTSQGVHLEKAAVIYHADIQHKDHTPQHPKYVTCECVFTVVHDVLVACTSVYNNPEVAEDYMDRIRGALRKETSKSLVKRFTVPPKDLRYHMLENLSFKFREPNLEATARQPRATLILNRFTRSLTIMYCTDAIEKVLGITKDYMVGKMPKEMILLLISSFWCRDPRHPHEIEELNQALDDKYQCISIYHKIYLSQTRTGAGRRNNRQRSGDNPPTREVLPVFQPIQLEAVISCTSDGLVVILRKAPASSPVEHRAVAPWGVNPIAPHVHRPEQNDRFVHGPEASSLQPGASDEEYIKSIRDVAVFAWALCGINGNIGAYGHGRPGPKSQPKVLPVYYPYGPSEIEPPLNQAEVDWARRLGKRKETGHSLGHVFREERNERREKRRKTGAGDMGDMRPQGYQQPVQSGYANRGNGYGHDGNGNGKGTGNGNGNGNGHNGHGNGTR
ncbi:hypothetical protein EYC84_003795 [Monilinia fructicola]|uniref:PAS domain-containing protein n=1 Tax=Monilinia fructicola TaxID=38448 RepID=A0A5M9JXE0_MONFR|nr:hypothetical protein EYC84_003795 [Monilinia fructicola]